MKTKAASKLMNLPAVALIVFLVAVFGLTACQRQGTAEKTGKKIDQAVEKAGNALEGTKESLGENANKAGAYMDDSAMTAKIKAEILSDPLLKVSQMNVTTTNGVVKLSGVVDSQQSIDRALEIARNHNPKSVDNSLVVKGVR